MDSSRNIKVGRKQYIDKVLYKPENYLFVGLRHIGKTTLLHIFEEEIFKRDNEKALYISLQGCENEHDIIKRIGLSIKKNNYEINHDELKKDTLFDYLENIETSDKSSEKIYLLIDEAEKIISIYENDKKIIDKFSEAINNTNKFIFLLASSVKLFYDMTPFNKFLSLKEIVSPLTKEESSELIKRLIPDVSEELSEKIMNYTYYFPYQIKMYIRTLKMEVTLTEYNCNINKDKEDKLEEIAIKTYTENSFMPNVFKEIFTQELTQEHHLIIDRIFKNKKKDKFEDFKKPEYRTYLDELKKFGYVVYDREKNQYYIPCWFFKYFLQSEIYSRDISLELKSNNKDIQTGKRIKIMAWIIESFAIFFFIIVLLMYFFKSK